jgi:hypothetical protein
VPSVVQSAAGDNGGTAAASYTLDLPANITAGNGVVVAASCVAGISSVAPVSGPDTFAAAAGGGGFASVYWLGASAGGYKGITVGQGSSDIIAVWIWEVPPLSGADKTASASGTASAYSSGTTAATAQASEFWAGIVTDATAPGTAPPGSPWTGSEFDFDAGSASAAQRIVTSTGTVTFSGPVGGPGEDSYWAAVATFKFASVSGPAAAAARRGMSQAVNRSATY